MRSPLVALALVVALVVYAPPGGFTTARHLVTGVFADLMQFGDDLVPTVEVQAP